MLAWPHVCEVRLESAMGYEIETVKVLGVVVPFVLHAGCSLARRIRKC